MSYTAGYYAIHDDCEYGHGNHRVGPFATATAADALVRALPGNWSLHYEGTVDDPECRTSNYSIWG